MINLIKIFFLYLIVNKLKFFFFKFSKFLNLKSKSCKLNLTFNTDELFIKIQIKLLL